MPSPFPGMNPYLEQADVWEDFHNDFIVRCREALNGQVGPNYIVKVETRLYVHELSEEERKFFGKADVGLSITGTSRSTQGENSSATLPAPTELRLATVDVEKQAWIDIRDRHDRRVVTSLELLSPSNKKQGPDRDDYLRKRNLLLISPIHFVEIDLRRGGRRPSPPEIPPCDYYALVSRREDRPRMGLWPIALRETLPTVPIPLSAPDPDARLDLQTVLHEVYDLAGYGKYVYSETPDPPLGPEDAEWAKAILAAKS